jgi:hypothetical protein
MHRQVQDRQLVLDAAVELAMILMAAAGGHDHGVRKFIQEAADRAGPLARPFQVVQAEFQERFTSRDLPPGMV